MGISKASRSLGRGGRCLPPPASRSAAAPRDALPFVLVPDLAHDTSTGPPWWTSPVHRAVLVDHHGQVAGRFCRSLSSRPTFLVSGTKWTGCTMRRRTTGSRFSSSRRASFDVDQTHHVVHGTLELGDAGEYRSPRSASHSLRAGGRVQGEDLGPGDHHLLHRGLGELEHAVIRSTSVWSKHSLVTPP